ncbi:MAG: glycosyltransferase [Chloroflexi bacterium]|nr:glycosyltransferase [Chloroflexota bacterium]
MVIVTRDRPEDLRVCLSAVLASSFRDFELVVVDQSATAAAAELVDQFARADRRVRLVRDDGKGAARARNIGFRATQGDIVVFTDDDCEPSTDWLGSLTTVLDADAGAGIAYGAVLPARHDTREGFIVGFVPQRRDRLTGRLAKLHDAGISANVAFRRAALEATGGFDEMLGPGGYFPCAEDFDLAYRVLCHGYALLHVPEAQLVHHGLRDWQSGSALIHRTYIAIGAAYMKHVRLRDGVGLALLAQQVYLAIFNITGNVVSHRSPVGFRRLSGLLTGVVRSFELGVEPSSATYSRSV